MFHTPAHKTAPGFPKAGQIVNDPRCALCALHYADGGVCDEGKPVQSPHRSIVDDVRFTNHGTIYLVSPQTADGNAWCEEHMPHAQRFGLAYAVEPRYVPAIAQGMIDDGLKVA